NERVGPVGAVVDHTTASRTTAKLDRVECIALTVQGAQLVTYPVQLLAVAKRHRRSMPAVVAKTHVTGSRIPLQQQKVGGHIGRGSVGASRQDIQNEHE